jgi:4-amino-4-deoxy-L-arabinose transferase-like glycosyltransferase
LIVLVGLIMLFTFLDYGATWDEEVQSKYGDNVLKRYTSFFRDNSAVANPNGVFDDIVMYGGFFEVIAQLAAKILPFGVYESRHLINCLFGLLAIVTAYELASYMAGPMAGFFSALFLTLTPVFYGHSFNNSKDIPFSTLFIISLYFILTSYDYMPRIPKKVMIRIGVSIGLAMGVRVGGIVLLGVLAVYWCAWLIVYLRFKPFDIANKNPVVSLSLSFGVILIIAWVVMLICWPWAQLNPLINPFKALAAFANANADDIEPFFNGRYLSAANYPRTYLPTWLSISLPEFYFISLFIGCLFTGGFIWKFKKDAEHFGKLIKTATLCFATFFPMVSAVVLRSNLYDGLRHVLFIIPPLAVIAGVSFSTLLRSEINWGLKTAASLLVATLAGLTVIDMIQLHPYQYIYFNRIIAGGLKAEYKKFDTEYWGSSYKEGAEWLIKNYHPDTKEVIRVANCANLFLTAYYLSKTEELTRRFKSVEDDQHPHIFVSTTRWDCHEDKKGKVLYVVERQGVPLLYVLELQDPQ